MLALRDNLSPLEDFQWTKSVKRGKITPVKDRRYNMREAAKELGVTRQTLYYWFKKGWIKPKRDYRDYPVFTTEDISSIKKWQAALKG